MEKERLEEILNEIGRMPLQSTDEEAALCKAVQEKGTDGDEMRQLEKARFLAASLGLNGEKETVTPAVYP